MREQVIFEKGRKAQEEWALLSVQERLRYFRRFRKLLAKQGEDIAKIVAQVTGKPSFEALTGEILTTLMTISSWEKSAAKQLRPAKVTTPLLLSGRRSWVEYRPLGVVLVIAPWNYPLQLTLIPSLSALLAGNAVILKPSEVTRELDSLLVDLFTQAQFPQDLIQVLSGDGELGARLVRGKPNLIFFTGSVKTGKTIQKVASEHLIPTILELGGKDPLIILDDANLERAVQGALWSSYTNAGQVCLGTERIYVQGSIYEQFLALFQREVSKLPPNRLISAKQAQLVQRHLEDALAKGANLVAGQKPGTRLGEAVLVEPLILANVHDEMLVAQEETFGPLVCVHPFVTDQEAVKLANSTQFGLGASIWSTDLKRAKALAKQIDAGNISINDAIITVANPRLPFGGVKLSGLGAYRGDRGLQAFCSPVAIMASKGRKKTELNWYPYNKQREELVGEVIKGVYGGRLNLLSLVKRALRRDVWF